MGRGNRGNFCQCVYDVIIFILWDERQGKRYEDIFLKQRSCLHESAMKIISRRSELHFHGVIPVVN